MRWLLFPARPQQSAVEKINHCFPAEIRTIPLPAEITKPEIATNFPPETEIAWCQIGLLPIWQWLSTMRWLQITEITLQITEITLLHNFCCSITVRYILSVRKRDDISNLFLNVVFLPFYTYFFLFACLKKIESLHTLWTFNEVLGGLIILLVLWGSVQSKPLFWFHRNWNQKWQIP